MTGPSAAAILPGLASARWFAGKGTPIGDLTIADRAAAGPGVTLALVDASGARYVAPVRDAGGRDAAADSGFVSWLLSTVFTGRVVARRAGSFAGHVVGSPPDSMPSADATAVVMGSDASNTSLAVAAGGAGLVVKLLRRCRPGIHPEVEVGGFLAEQADFPDTPRLRGWLEYVPAGGGPGAALAIVHDLAAGCVSGWDRLSDDLAAGGLAGSRKTAVLTLVAAIGTLTGRLHRALAARDDLPAFAPVTETQEQAAAAAAATARRAVETLDRVVAGAAILPPDVARRLRRLGEARERLRETLAAPSSAGPSLIRVHGDYHLGQVLVAADGRPMVIDFEGEPGRPLAERRARTHAAKDVAGMCRSFDYLVRRGAGVPAERRDDARPLERTFLDAYGRIADGTRWWPDDPAEAAALVSRHALDKAVYELAYEFDNRPEWIDVPLGALEFMVAAP